MIPSIITPMNFTLVRDSICQHLANCRENQKELAREAGEGEEWISKNIHFVVFPKRFRFPDVEDMPCVYVYFNELNFPEDEQDSYCNEANGNLVVEYYTVGLNDDEESETEKDADTNAEDRLNYLTAQLYKILCSEATNLYTATGKMIKGFTLKSWKRIITPESDNTAGTVLGAKFDFNVEFSEPTYYANTFEIKEFYTKMNIREEFIDPFVQVILKTN